MKKSDPSFLKNNLWKSNLFLAMILLVISSLAIWYQYQQKPKVEKADELSKKIFSMGSATDSIIDTISIHKGTQSVSLRCMDQELKLCKNGDQSRWNLESPLQQKADDSSVNALVASLSQLSANETIDLSDESSEKRKTLLTQFQVTPETSQRKIEVKLNHGKIITAYFGSTYPIGEQIYCATSDSLLKNKVFLIPGFFKSQFERELSYWRNKKLFSFGTADIQHFTIESSKDFVDATVANNSWTLNQQYPGDLESISNFLGSATALIAKSFAAENKNNPSAIALLKGAKKVLVLVFSSAQRTTTVELYDKKPLLFAKVSDQDPLYELDANVRDRLTKTVRDLRLSRLLTTVDRYNTIGIKIQSASTGELKFTKKDSKWWLGQQEAEFSKLNNLLDHFSGNRILDFLPSTSNPAQQPTLKNPVEITFDTIQVNGKNHFILGECLNQKLCAQPVLNSKIETWIIDPSIQEALPKTKDDFKKTSP